MKATHLLLTVNTSTCWKTALHLTNLVPCTVCYIYNSIALTEGSMFHGYQTLVL